MFYCPTPNPRNFKDWTCIRIDELCNGFPDCPGAEDEDPTLCMYWLAVSIFLIAVIHAVVHAVSLHLSVKDFSYQ